MNHYFICQPIDSSKRPFLVMLSQFEHDQLAIASKRGERAMHDAERKVFGEVVEHFARLTTAEFFDALRVASGKDAPDGTDGPKVPVPDQPQPRGPKPRSKLQQRLQAALAAGVQS